MPTITFDGKEYETESLPDQAQGNIDAVRFIDNKIDNLRREIAALTTARNAYLVAIKEDLPK